MYPVPKIIHQIWYQGREKIPPKIQEMQLSFSNNMSDWDLRVYDERDLNNLISKDYPEYHEFYLNLDKMISKVDFARCLLLHKYGGIYSDVDIVCYKNISTLLENIMDGKIRQIDITNNKSFIPNESSYSEIEFDIILSEEWPFSARPIYYGGDANCSISNSIMISKPNIPFWIDYVQYIKIEFNLNKIASHKDVFQSSGPIALGSLVRVNDNSINKIILLPCNYLQCCGLKLGSDFYLPETDISDMDLLNKIKIAQIIHGKLVWGPFNQIDKDDEQFESTYTIHHSLRTWQN